MQGLVLIDGYNVIRRTLGLRQSERISLQHGREALILQLAARYATTPHQIVVVFDGDGQIEGHDRRLQIAIVYTPAHETADECIVRRAQEAKARGQQVSICTDDKAIRAALGNLTPQVMAQSARELGQDLIAAPRLLAKQHQHRSHIRQQMQTDRDADDRTPDRRGNPRRSPKRPRR